MSQLPSDPIMLYSVINTKLRDQYQSLEELCEDLDVDKAQIIAKLSQAGFLYNKDLNKFV